MCTQFTRAILRLPGENFAAGITTSIEGAPDYQTALAQHAAYAQALEQLGVATQILPADPAYPDGVFVEDTAIVTPEWAIVTRPGAEARAGETLAIEGQLLASFDQLRRIEAPGTVDGGDICETDEVVLIGVSHRTNEAGARRLAAILHELGRPSELIDIRGIASLLHLKTGIGYLGEGRLAVAPDAPDLPAFQRFEQIRLDPAERYAANCVRVNDKVLIPTEAPRFAERLARLGYQPLALDMSEFRKMDGGLSCLSLRF
jgi:dimethylargininase